MTRIAGKAETGRDHEASHRAHRARDGRRAVDHGCARRVRPGQSDQGKEVAEGLSSRPKVRHQPAARRSVRWWPNGLSMLDFAPYLRPWAWAVLPVCDNLRPH